jgi:hypothetical protein
VASSIVKTDPLSSDTNVELSIDNFDFAMRISCQKCAGKVEKPQDIHQYFSFLVTNTERRYLRNSIYDKNNTVVNFEPCDSTRVKGLLNGLFQDEFICFNKSQKLYFAGSSESPYSQYVQLNVDFCNQTTLSR